MSSPEPHSENPEPDTAETTKTSQRRLEQNRRSRKRAKEREDWEKKNPGQPLPPHLQPLKHGPSRNPTQGLTVRQIRRRDIERESKARAKKREDWEKKNPGQPLPPDLEKRHGGGLSRPQGLTEQQNRRRDQQAQAQARAKKREDWEKKNPGQPLPPHLEKRHKTGHRPASGTSLKHSGPGQPGPSRTGQDPQPLSPLTELSSEELSSEELSPQPAQGPSRTEHRSLTPQLQPQRLSRAPSGTPEIDGSNQGTNWRDEIDSYDWKPISSPHGSSAHRGPGAQQPAGNATDIVARRAMAQQKQTQKRDPDQFKSAAEWAAIERAQQQASNNPRVARVMTEWEEEKARCRQQRRGGVGMEM
jgi:hypothetical protein